MLATRRIAAVVVSYNRCKLLQKVIDALLLQTEQLDIIVVDNCSTDDTSKYLDTIAKCINDTDESSISLDGDDEEYGKMVYYHRTRENVGGAGGFNIGMKLAYQRAYDYFWLLDDDAVPDNDALEKLMLAAKGLSYRFGYLAGRVVFTDGSNCLMNRVKYIDGEDEGYRRIKQATFVSLLVNRNIVSTVGYPIKDFFIWGDDVEYTRRIAVRSGIPSYYVEDSVTVHHVKVNEGSSISRDLCDRIDRYFYAYRNEAYLFRLEGMKGIIYFILKCILNAGRIIFISKDNKIKRMRILLKGIKAGIGFDPSIEYPGGE